MSNMTIWDKLRTPHKDALKTIQAGRLKGMSDINPQWRLMAMTEQFGPIGVGWWYSVVAVEYPLGPEGQVACMVQIEMYIIQDGKTSSPISGVGGSTLVAKESKGLRLNDEALKMATTDALSVAMKQLGVAADVYMNNMDGSKYQKPEDVAAMSEEISQEQGQEILQLINDSGADIDEFLKYFKIGMVEQLVVSQYKKAKDMLLKKKAALK